MTSKPVPKKPTAAARAVSTLSAAQRKVVRTVCNDRAFLDAVSAMAAAFSRSAESADDDPKARLSELAAQTGQARDALVMLNQGLERIDPSSRAFIVATGMISDVDDASGAALDLARRLTAAEEVLKRARSSVPRRPRVQSVPAEREAARRLMLLFREFRLPTTVTEAREVARDSAIVRVLRVVIRRPRGRMEHLFG